MPPRPRFTPPDGRPLPEQPVRDGGRTRGSGLDGARLPGGAARPRRRDGLPAPVTLGGQELNGQEITYPSQYVPIEAWVPFTDGIHRRIRGFAVGWTRQAVKIAWRTGGEEPVEHQAWVWAPAVSRAQLPGPNPTDNPATNANWRSRSQPPAASAPEFRPSVRPPRTRPW